VADTATALISGPVLAVTRRAGTSVRDGEPRAYAFTLARVLVESRDVVEVNIPDEMVTPIQGEDCALVCELRAYKARDGAARLGVRAVEALALSAVK
jgi:hypothetical protein